MIKLMAVALFKFKFPLAFVATFHHHQQ